MVKKETDINISIDFETYSEADIYKKGAFAYADDPTTKVLMVAWVIDEGEPKLWTQGQPPPTELFELVSKGAKLWAWNVQFEIAVWHRTLQWPKTKIVQWNDTAALAAAQAYPRALAKCGEALGLAEDQKKSKRGKLLIQRLCKPYRGKKLEDKQLLIELGDYCKQDVVAEREIRKRLRNLRGMEQEIFFCDLKINWRGVMLDKQSIKSALAIIEKHTKQCNEKIKTLTDNFLDTSTSRAKACEWAATQNYDLKGYDKLTVAQAIDDPTCPKKVKQFLKIRQSLSKTSTKKFDAMLACIAKDGRAHGLLSYHGAATGRWVGRHFQPQNLPRPSVDNVEEIIKELQKENPLNLPGDPMEALASCLRGMLTASKGNRLMVADFASIEARVLAWLANAEQTLQIFKDKKDIYKATASSMFNVKYDEVTKQQRFIGKVATLALGYQGGVRAFQKMSTAYGVEVDESQALKVRNDWRDVNKDIVRLWANVERAARNAISYKDEYEVCKGVFKMVNGDLLFKLPSNRLLSFPAAELVPSKFGIDIVYKGVNNHTHKFGEIKAYGGFLVQSITQAVARDILAEAVLRLEKAKYPIVLHVHDEIIADVPKAHGTMYEFAKIMCENPIWAEGLPIEADGYEAFRYAK